MFEVQDQKVQTIFIFQKATKVLSNCVFIILFWLLFLLALQQAINLLKGLIYSEIIR